ncbi:nicotinamide mononucleotide transporter [Francisella tularensis subsp. novicida]|uniref:Nicotinamide riboside transporter PnuC n=4 Tax=Francisella tularensis TaxID=263 RepID=A0A6I4RR27_FRATU|nr:nicotinamide riboside transporter PnuC [Francisella tularensis]ABK90594.1 nicotinamide ribonucleoside (NR) uptake permease (PnuC) family protein [Francisella tularensis subsp. novicida U112]AJI61977.1 nicotinamide mononucleotide transporter PnuC family protein [Francisella tularensis subsp. novicida U112]APC94481.1 nicotinamide mononucleotide transporter PnuC family protein [Francisella tularensis subsp. novicida]EDX19262.1 nicotinamide mononucleotide transporter family protein [Francisella 
MNVLKSTFTGWSKKEVVWLCSCILLTILAAYLSGSSSFILIYSIIGITNLILAAKGKVFNYVLGLIGALMYAVISYQNHVFGQLLLAIFFLCPIQFYGWYNWTRPHNNTIEQQIKIKKLTQVQFMKIISSIAVVSAIYGYFVLHLYFGQSVGLFADAIVEVTSIVAFILTVLIYREHWLLWLTIDVLTISIWVDGILDAAITIAIIPVIITKVVALINAIYGYMSWRKIYKLQKKS